MLNHHQIRNAFYIETIIVLASFIGLFIFGLTVGKPWLFLSIGLVTYIFWNAYYLYYFIICLPSLGINNTFKYPAAIGVWKQVYKLVSADIKQHTLVNKMRKDFIANVSHELRTPITVITGYLETLEDQFKKDEVFLYSIQNMQQQSNRMNTIIEDLLILSNLEHDENNTENHKEISVSQLIESIIKDVQSLHKKLKFSVSIDDKLTLSGNETEIRSVFTNLINNAINYTADEGHIQVKWQIENFKKTFSVTDNGIGIAAKHIERLTERFYRVDKSRSRDRGGSGLGLAIVKHILTQHHGELHIQSKLKQGSTFTCSF